jgi:hypothetical protein
MNQSNEIHLLNEALAKAQGTFPAIPKKKTARVKMKAGGEYCYKYADLADVLSAALPKLTENGLSLRQPVRHLPDGMRLVTELHHSSGQFTSDDGLPLSRNLSPQEFGSELTYMRRYGACGMLGLAPDEDEDAKLVSESKNRKREEQAAQGRNERAMVSGSAPEVGTPIVITNEQKARIQDALKANGKKAAALYAFLDLKVGSPIPASRFQEALAWVGSKPSSADMPQKVCDAFQILGWTEFEITSYVENHESRWDDILTSLNQMIDANNEKQ